MVTAITDATFEQTVLKSDIPVLVDFWAPWCGPCKALAPVLDALDAEIGARVAITKMNVDEEQKIAGQYRLRAVPTLMLFASGKILAQTSGAMSKEQLAAWIEQNLQAASAA